MQLLLFDVRIRRECVYYLLLLQWYGRLLIIDVYASLFSLVKLYVVEVDSVQVGCSNSLLLLIKRQ